MADDLYLRRTHFLDVDHPRVAAFTAQAVAGATDPVDRAVRLYHAVRDGLRYDPYAADLGPDGLVASTILDRGRGYCVAKATVLATVARHAGIPARLGFADVRNHLATPRLLELMGTDVFYYHGYTELLLEGRWVKATPAFNIELCQKFGVLPLEFDGRHDSLFQPFDTQSRRHMEYLLDRGPRADVPLEELREAMQRYYPALAAAPAGGDFHDDAWKTR